MEFQNKIYVAGHTGMVGSAIVRRLKKEGYKRLILRTSKELDLRNQQAVYDFFEEEKPDYVFLAAAKVGGIQANNRYRAEFLFDNLSIQNNIIHAAYLSRVSKLLFLGSSCIYPKEAKIPIREDSLLTGALEYTNEPYAIAKIAGVKLCEAYWDQYGCKFISAMPTNLYGPNDNYDLESAHVLPALLRKMHNAKKADAPSVVIWGTGNPKREFMHVDDLADACLFLMKNYHEREFVNIGSGEEISIKDLAQLIAKTVDYSGEIVHDLTKPDGTYRKLMDHTKLSSLGWKSKIELRSGIEEIYSIAKNLDWY